MSNISEFMKDIQEYIKKNGLLDSFHYYYPKKKVLMLSFCILSNIINPYYRGLFIDRYLSMIRSSPPIFNFAMAQELSLIECQKLFGSESEIFGKCITLSLKIIEATINSEKLDINMLYIYDQFVLFGRKDFFLEIIKKHTGRRNDYLEYGIKFCDIQILEALNYDPNTDSINFTYIKSENRQEFVKNYINRFGYNAIIRQLTKFRGQLFSYLKHVQGMTLIDLKKIIEHICHEQFEDDFEYILYVMIMKPDIGVSINQGKISQILETADSKLFECILSARQLIDPGKKNAKEFVSHVKKILLRLTMKTNLRRPVANLYEPILSNFILYDPDESHQMIYKWINKYSIETCVRDIDHNLIMEHFDVILSAEASSEILLKFLVIYDLQGKIRGEYIDLLSKIPERASFEYHDLRIEYILKYGAHINTNYNNIKSWSKKYFDIFMDFCTGHDTIIKPELFWALLNTGYLLDSNKFTRIKLSSFKVDYKNLSKCLIEHGFKPCIILSMIVNNIGFADIDDATISAELQYVLSMRDDDIILTSNEKKIKKILCHFALLEGIHPCWNKPLISYDSFEIDSMLVDTN